MSSSSAASPTSGFLHAAQLSRGAKLVKRADKICNLRDIVEQPPADWPLRRKRQYFDWAKQVVDELRGTSPALESVFDRVFLVRSAWVRFVRRLDRNRAIRGDSEDLHEFLLGSERASLEPYKPILRDVQQGRCFYCARPVAGGSENVDHFVPWSRYPVDLAHNFVLTDAFCDDSKSDLLASVDHLERADSPDKLAPGQAGIVDGTHLIRPSPARSEWVILVRHRPAPCPGPLPVS